MSTNSRRHRRTGHLSRAWRFVRLESLEPRMTLDASAAFGSSGMELGIVQPDQGLEIRLPVEIWQPEDHGASDRSPTFEFDTGLGDEMGSTGSGPSSAVPPLEEWQPAVPGSDRTAVDGRQDRSLHSPPHRGFGNSGALEDLIVIPAPPPTAEFLPLAANSRQATSSGLPAGDEPRPVGTQTADEALADGLALRATLPASLSPDEYFGSTDARRPVAWSAHSAASQSRQHAWEGMIQRTPADPTQAERAARQQAEAFDLTLASLAHGQGPNCEAPSEVRIAELPETSLRPHSLRELLARYQPHSALAGIWWVAAHWMAERPVARAQRLGRGRLSRREPIEREA